MYPILSKYILADKHAVVVDLQRSYGSWLVDEDGKERLDCFSQFASQPLGWNHPKVKERSGRLFHVAIHNIANSDVYTNEYMKFVETFARITPDFTHHFFIAGGTLGVENALKAAFDWKANKFGMKEGETEELDVIHLSDAFHGRSGYTMSLTNTEPVKTDLYPKFKWTRLTNPKLCKHWPTNQDIALEEAENRLKSNMVAAIIIETIQGEGGDNHFDESFFRNMRSLADRYEAMLIFDEVQCGMGLTGKAWCYQHFGITPDLIAFGKKTQVCGFSSTRRIDEVENNVFNVPSRINSTWGGNLVDMVRSTIYMEIIEEDALIESAACVGQYFLKELGELELNNLRGRGLMIAFDLESGDKRDEFLDRLSERMLAMKCGPRSVRLRPHLTFTKDEVDLAVDFIRRAI